MTVVYLQPSLVIVIRVDSCKVIWMKQHIGSFKYNSGNIGAGWLVLQVSMFKEGGTFQTSLKPGPYFSFLSLGQS